MDSNRDRDNIGSRDCNRGAGTVTGAGKLTETEISNRSGEVRETESSGLYRDLDN